MSVAITGASGFIGSRLAAHMVWRGHDVTSIVRRRVSEVSGRVVVVPDLGDIHALSQAIADATHVVHLADESGRFSAPSTSPPIAASLLKALDPDHRLIFASSIYARLDEEGLASVYGARKRAQEEILLQFPKAVGLRLPPVYGEGCGGSYAMLEKAILRGIPLPFGRATAGRSFLSIENLCGLIEAIVEAPVASWETLPQKLFEPSDEELISTSNLARLIGRSRGVKTRLLPVPETPLRILARLTGREALVRGAFDPLASRDNDALRAVFGWQPEPSNYHQPPMA